jgi:hypothetical protein
MNKRKPTRLEYKMLKALHYIVNCVPEPGEDAELNGVGYNMACNVIQEYEKKYRVNTERGNT